MTKKAAHWTGYWSGGGTEGSKLYQYQVYEEAARIAKANPGLKVLDLGCGTAYKLMKLIYPHSTHITGVDLPEAIAVSKRIWSGCDGSNVRLVAADLEDPSACPAGKFDLIICANLIHQLDNPDCLMECIRKCSHENTIILISTPDKDSANVKRLPRHKREFGREDLADYVNSHNLEILHHRNLKRLRFSLKPRFLAEYMRLLVLGGLRSNQLIVCRVNKKRSADDG